MIKRPALAPVSQRASSRDVTAAALAATLSNAFRLAARHNRNGGQHMVVQTRAAPLGPLWRVTATVRATASDFIWFNLSW